MTNVHVLADESLDGIQREYVEVDRPAEVGDYVTRDGIIREVEKRSNVWDGVEFEPYLDDDGEDTFRWIDGYYKTLEPTDIIQIDGQRYRMVDHKAEVGEKVIVIYDDSRTVNKGTVLTVTNVTGYDIDTDRKFTIDTRYDEYLVLVPLESADNDSIAVDESEASPSVVEMLGNLARRIVSLERQVESNATAIVDIQQDIGEIRDKVERLADTCEQSATTIARLTRKVAQLERENTDIKRDLETWVQEVERLKRKLDDDRRDIEMVIDDIVTLDDRTQPEEMAKKVVEVLTKGLKRY